MAEQKAFCCHVMSDLVTIFYDGSNTIDVVPGRALRLSGMPYPLFRPPDPAAVGAPDDCLDFLTDLHLSLCGVFEIRHRRWLTRYFSVIRELVENTADSLPSVAGLDPEVSHRAWCYAAYRPLSNVSFELDGAVYTAPLLLWLDDGPLAIRFVTEPTPSTLRTAVFDDALLEAPLEDFVAGIGGDVARYWQDVAAPRHPFVRSALSGLLD